MSSYWQLTVAQLRLFARNKQVLFFTFFFPVFFMVMFGLLLGNNNGTVADGILIDRDKSQASEAFVQALGQQQQVLNMETMANEDEALGMLRKGDKQLVVVIPEGYGTKLASLTQTEAGAGQAIEANAQAEQASVTVYYDQTQAAKAGNALNAMSQVVDGISKQIVHYEPVVTIEPKGVQSLNLQYIDFLVPGIVAMMIMSNNLNGVAGQIASWRERGVLRRMQSTPLSASSFIAAQITARLLMNGTQAVIVLLIGALIFGTQVNGSWLLLLFFVIIGTLAFMAIGFIIAGLAKTPESAGPIAGFISFPMMFLGGVFFPINSMPEFLQPIVKALPISHLSTALRQVMNVGAGFADLWVESLTLGLWLIAAFIAASFTFKWE
ncbi:MULTISPECIES: ABC transporter permease [unclassified Paenibacillus]|uniref:ABC transporter permease n=1 Tax=unclassified Paenibacillus TaxID=185978 RepID=UPI001C1164C7|nr:MULTISPECIES: ABC transporter permease [unclassified Paenibacillus]MBU5445497.1 ABC transporter permease [Paenibacillus sp. MSJ-34]CAH0122020.1 putative multidrug ABC transporter permease YbhR [Paenibacillus sp. CECT 9249]